MNTGSVTTTEFAAETGQEKAPATERTQKQAIKDNLHPTIKNTKLGDGPKTSAKKPASGKVAVPKKGEGKKLKPASMKPAVVEVKKPAAKKAAPKKAAKKTAPKKATLTTGKSGMSVKANKPAAPKKTAAKAKGKLGGARPGAGRPVEIDGKKRQTIDFTGGHHKALTALVKAENADGISPLIRTILDKHLPAMLNKHSLPAMK